MRYLLFTSNNGRREVHCYNDSEVSEVFGAKAPILAEHGFLIMPTGIWVDMQRTAIERTEQIKACSTHH